MKKQGVIVSLSPGACSSCLQSRQAWWHICLQPCTPDTRMLVRMKVRTLWLTSAALLLGCGYATAGSETIGSVDTVFKWIGPDHKPMTTPRLQA